jgi:serine/threonine-protein kinase
MKQAQEAQITVPPKLIAHIAREMLSGLAYSHRGARGGDGALLRVIHRDLSPVNILLSLHGEVKITDFGVAKVLREAAVSETTTVAGHLGYMAPEQAEAKAFDERADLFAVGVVLWELLCGRRLFHRGGPAPTLVALMGDKIEAPSTQRQGLDPAWDALVMRALARQAADRFESAAAMAAALTDLPDAQGLPCPEALAEVVSELVARIPPSARTAPLPEDVPTMTTPL